MERGPVGMLLGVAGVGGCEHADSHQISRVSLMEGFLAR